MSRRRVSSTRSKARRGSDKIARRGEAKTRKTGESRVRRTVVRFIGISLSGGRADKACMAVVEYYPDQNRLFLSRVFEKIKAEEFISADLKIHEILLQFKENLEFVAMDAPLSMPKCVVCKLKCPGYETCSEPELEWMRELNKEINRDKKPKKMFTPYTQRCVEAYLGHHFEQNDVHHALGANLAPMAARAQFIARRWDYNTIEVSPRLTFMRLATSLKMTKMHINSYRHSVGGEESRRAFLENLVERKFIFLYQQDQKVLAENQHAFDALLCAYTAFLKFMNQTELCPKDFPKDEQWIEFPKA